MKRTNWADEEEEKRKAAASGRRRFGGGGQTGQGQVAPRPSPVTTTMPKADETTIKSESEDYDASESSGHDGENVQDEVVASGEGGHFDKRDDNAEEESENLLLVLS